jgi:hypothetical protein
MQIYVKSNRRDYGPYSLEQLRELVGKGTFLSHDSASVGDSGLWTIIEKIPGFHRRTAKAKIVDTATCPFCRDSINAQQVQLCPGCGAPHHGECWSQNGGCTVYGCSGAPSEEPRIVITGESLAQSGQQPRGTHIPVQSSKPRSRARRIRIPGLSRSRRTAKPIVGPVGLGGWLILPMLGLFITPIFTVYTIINDLLPVFEDEAWASFTTRGGEFYHPDWQGTFIVELFGNVAIASFAVILIVMFFSKSRSFPSFFITFLIVHIIFLMIDFLLAVPVLEDVFPDFAMSAKKELGRDFGRSIIGGFIWIPYMLKSKRVRNTFVN